MRYCQGNALLHEHVVARACVPGLWEGSATKLGEMLKDFGSHNLAQAGGEEISSCPLGLQWLLGTAQSWWWSPQGKTGTGG